MFSEGKASVAGAQEEGEAGRCCNGEGREGPGMQGLIGHGRRFRFYSGLEASGGLSTT